MDKRLLGSIFAVVLIVLLSVAYFLFGNRPNEKEIGDQVAMMMQNKIDDQGMKQFHVTVDKVTVIHDEGNKYQGVAIVTMDGERHDIAVKILADGKNVMYEADPTQFAFVARSAIRKSMAENDSRAESAKSPVFITMEPYTVNLKSEGGDQFLQVTLTLQVPNAAQAEILKSFMPQVRSRLLFLLSSKKASEISGVEGKKKLSEEIISTVNQPLTPNGSSQAVSDVFFTSFTIQ